MMTHYQLQSVLLSLSVAAMCDTLQAAFSAITDDVKKTPLSSYIKQQDALRQNQVIDYDHSLQPLF